MSKEQRESSKSNNNQPPVYITNKIINNVNTPAQKPKKSKGSIGIILTLAGVIIALLTFLFGEGILNKPPEPGTSSSTTPPSSAETPEVTPSSTEAGTTLNQAETQSPTVDVEDGQTIVKAGQTVKVYTDGESDFKVYYKVNGNTTADYVKIGKRGSQDGKLFHDTKMNPQGGYFPLTKWDYFYMTVIDGEISLDAGDDGIIKFEDTPLVVSREIHAGETYETTVIGKGTATLTIKGIEEETKGEYQVYPHNSSSEDPKSFDHFPTDAIYKMLYSGDKIVITVTSGAVEIYGDSTHFQFQ